MSRDVALSAVIAICASVLVASAFEIMRIRREASERANLPEPVAPGATTV